MGAWSITPFLETGNQLDLAAEHYHPDKLDNSALLLSLSEDTVGDFYDSQRDLFDPRKTPIPRESYTLDLTDALGNFIDDIDGPRQTSFDSSKKIAEPGDLIVSRLRSYLREIAIIPPLNGLVLVSSEFVVLRPKPQSHLSTEILLPFLLSSPVQTILKWSRDGSEHPRFSDSVLLSLPVPKSLIDQHESIRRSIKIALRSFRKSRALYGAAEKLLLQGLDLIEAIPVQIPNSTVMAQRVFASRRWDSEYWQPKYSRLIDHLLELPHTTLDGVDFSNGATPRGANYPSGGIPFLRIQNIAKNRLDLDDVVFIDKETHEGLLKRSQLKPRDVLITITGRIGTSAVVPKTLSVANINQHIVRARLHSKSINPYYLSVFLNSPAGLLQTERESYGTTRDALPYYVLRRVIIPDASEDLQKSIEAKIHEAESAERRAKTLLTGATMRVEQLVGRQAGPNGAN